MYRIPVGDSVRCAVNDICPRGDTAILFVHGWPFSQEIFDCQYTVLPEYGIRCVGMDLRGYGNSDKPWQGYRYDQMADDLNRVVASIDCRCLILCGFSMGAAICVRYLSRYGDRRISKLALCAGACPSFVRRPGYPYGMSREQVDGLISQCYHNRPQMCADFVRTCFASNPGEDYLRWMTDLCLQSPGHAIIHGADSLRDEDLRQDLGNVRIPTAIYHGVLDRVCPYPFAEEMHRGIPGSLLVPFEQSGHCLFFEEKDKFNQCLVEFASA